MKTYRQHNCTKCHRTYRTFAQCSFRQDGHWVVGEGQYASMSWCTKNEPESYRRGISVHLFNELEQALEAKRLIDETACGGRCRKQHEIIRLDLTS